jgi:REP element-mobilizing transposase RayT/DNA-binding NarL/FixJ family response regulator
MSALILVATPHTAFGELLRISLEESAQYQVRLAQSAKEARAAAEKGVFQLAVIDTAINDEPFVPFCYDLLELQPGIRLVVVPPENNPNHPSLGGLIPHGYLNRPFYLPDLIDVVSRLLSDREKQLRAQNPQAAPPNPSENAPDAAASPSALPPWLQEPLTLQSYLEKELANTEALAGVIGITGPEPGTGALRAAAGQFEESPAQELTTIIFRYWNSREKTDMMRFVRLASDKKDYLIYATQIAGDLVLILVYDNSAPLSQIRPQTKALAQAMACTPPEDYLSGDRTVFAVSTEPVTEIPEAPAGPAVKEPAAPEDLESLEEQAAPKEPTPPEETPLPDQAGQQLWQPVDLGAQEENTRPAARVSAVNEPQTEPLDDSFVFGRLNAGQVPEAAAADAGPSLVEAEDAPPTAPEFADLEASEPGLDDEPIDANIINLSALLGSVPSPDPDKKVRQDLPFAGDWVLERASSSPIPTLPGGYNGYGHSNDQAGEPEPAAPAGEPQAGEPAQDLAPQEPAAPAPEPPAVLPQTAPLDPKVVEEAVHRRFIDPDTYPTAPSGRPASLEVNTEPPVKSSLLQPVENPPASAHEPEIEDVISPREETHPSVVTTIANLAQFEPVSPALSLLNYTCVLVPRLPQHYLTGELADKMAAWVQQLCLAFGWRLEGISVRPEYLQWTVQVAPAVSPGNLVRVIRQRTSQHIFSSFPGLATHNPSGDFWAIGYLIVSGSQPPSAQLLRDYIAQTRKRQGINRT